jgi:hypothetical protein
MNRDDKPLVYMTFMTLGISFMLGVCLIAHAVLDYLEKSSAIKAGLIQELRTDDGVTRVIWVKGKND